MKKNLFLIACLVFAISATTVNAQNATNSNNTKNITEASIEKNAEEIQTKAKKKTKCSANIKNSPIKSCCADSKKECSKEEKAKCVEKKKCTKSEKAKCSEKKAMKTSYAPKTKKCTANLSALPKNKLAD